MCSEVHGDESGQYATASIDVSFQPGKSLISVSKPWRAWFEGGKASTSLLAIRSCRKGVPKAKSTTSAGTRANHGLRITHIAMACHAPVPAGRRVPSDGTIRLADLGHQSTRSPRIANAAGRKGKP